MPNYTLLSLFGFWLIIIACERRPPASDVAAAALEKGLEIAGATQAAMGTQLQQAMQTGGVAHAVQYCNIAAYPIADSLAKVYQATIRRATDRPRNALNALTEAEAEVFGRFQAQQAAGEPIAPIVQTLKNGEYAVYAPIMMQPLCQNCHGQPSETIQDEHLALIRSLYPNDKATGYTAGDLRGMWSITVKN